MERNDFNELFLHICEIKTFVLKLSVKELKDYKHEFYSRQIQEWILNIMWEYIWGDKDYETMQSIFISAKVIKGDKK